MGLSDFMKQDAEAMYRAARGLFAMVDDLSWKPARGSNWMTTGQLLRHCAEACGKPMEGLVTGSWPTPPDAAASDEAGNPALPPAERLPAVESVEEPLRLLEEDRALCTRLLDEVGDDRLMNERSAAPWGGPERALYQHLNEMIWHLGQHKGQLFYYLKLQGKPVNTMDLWMGGE